MGCILSLDGGGTKLLCVIADESGQYLGHGTGGPTNSNFNSPEDIRQAMDTAISEALAVRSTSRSDIDHVYAALPVKPEIFTPLASQVTNTKVGIHMFSEFQLSLFGALQSDYGGLVQAGTGSFACLQVPKGSQRATSKTYKRNDGTNGYYTVGAWGAIFGDEGSGFWIGREALIRFFEMCDGRRDETSLRGAVLKHLSAITPDDVVHAVYPHNAGVQRRVVASLCPVIGCLAADNEPNALEIIESASTILASQMMVALRKAEIQGMTEEFHISVAGGVWKSHPLLFRNFEQIIENNFRNCVVKPPLYEPVIGGVLLGLRDVGLDIYERSEFLREQYQDFLFPVHLLEDKDPSRA